MSEGASSSGRALLWHDSLKMVPSFALIGCGSEGFRKAFLAFKSKQLAEISPRGNNESSHNSYLDAAISFGLPGAALYIAIIVYALKLWLRARAKASAQNWRIALTGLAASFAAALTHNIFIFDQIATGFYFFAFVALAQVASNIFDAIGERVTSSPLPSGAYDYLFARAVDTFVRKLPAASNSTEQSRQRASDIGAIRTDALSLAIKHLEKSLPGTITP